MKFKSDTFGMVSGIRFYKAAANTGTHIGTLWTSGGTKLAQVTFTGETASGWQQANFSTPVIVRPRHDLRRLLLGTQRALLGHLAGPEHGGRQPAAARPGQQHERERRLRVRLGGVVPDQHLQRDELFVDVVFSTAGAPGQVTNVNATPDSGAANVTWTAPTGSDPVTTYTVTPYIGTTAQTPTTVTGSPPVTNARVHDLTGGHDLHLQGDGVEPQRRGSGVRPLQRGDSDVGLAGHGAAQPGRGPRLAVGPGQLGGAGQQRRQPGHRLHRHPVRGPTAQATTPVGGSALSATVTGLTNNTTYTFKVAATTAAGTGAQSTATTAVTPQKTIFDWTTPGTVDSGDGNPVELGVKFKSDVAGSVTGIRFHKAAANTGTHIGGLWTTAGTQLASATTRARQRRTRRRNQSCETAHRGT